MLAFLALVLAVVAIVVANNAQREVRRLRAELARQAPAPMQAVESAPLETVVPEQAPPLPPPPPPPPVTPPPIEIPKYVPPPAAKTAIDWENLVGIRLFSWIAGIALVLAAVFLFKYSVDHGWLRPAVRATFGIATGVALLIVCELRFARNYRFTANALDGAGIAILYATLFALHGRWQLWPAAAAFGGMLIVTAVAVFLSTRRDSVFIALLGLLGGFATPALLSSGENRPVALFSYLLLLNGGISWIAWRKRWPLLTALSLFLTLFYQWSWVDRFLDSAQLPLAAAIFLVFAAVGASSLLWSGQEERQATFRHVAAAGAALPIIFAFFTAVVPEYGAQVHVLFAFLLFLAGGLAAIAIWRGPEWLHPLGALAVLLTFFLWLTVSYTHASWPLSLLWLAAFVVLYLVVALRQRGPAVYAAGILFFVFVGLAIREPGRSLTLTGAMLALLAIVVVFALMRSVPWVAVVAVVLASIATMAARLLPASLFITTQLILFALLLLLAWKSTRYALAVAAIPLSIAVHIAAERYPDWQQLLLGAGIYALFLLFPLVLGTRLGSSKGAHIAAALAGGVFFVHAYEMRAELGYDAYIGALPIAQALLMIGLMWQLLRMEAVPSRLAIVAGTALAFLTAAVPVQLENEWITVAWALEAAALAWLFTRIEHRGLLVWVVALAALVTARLILNPAVFDYHPKAATPLFNWYLYTYVVCAAAMFAITWLLPERETAVRRVGASTGTVILFFLLNVEIADYYSTGRALTFNFFSSSLAQELTYTFGWALFAMAMLVAGIVLQSRSARIAALGLLLITILKCFLHDLARLGGLYRVASLFGLAVSLVLVGIMLQRFVIMRRAPTSA